MYLWNKGGVQVSGGFCLLAAWFALVNGGQLLAMVALGCAVHELGHYLALRCQGVRVTGLRICVLGAEMTADRSGLSYGGELAAVLAGAWLTGGERGKEADLQPEENLLQ